MANCLRKASRTNSLFGRPVRFADDSSRLFISSSIRMEMVVVFGSVFLFYNSIRTVGERKATENTLPLVLTV